MGSSPQMSRPRVGQKHPSYFLEPEKRGIAYSFPLFYEFQFVLLSKHKQLGQPSHNIITSQQTGAAQKWTNIRPHRPTSLQASMFTLRQTHIVTTLKIVHEARLYVGFLCIDPKKTGLTYWIAYSPFCLVNERLEPPSRIMSSLMIRHVRHNPIPLDVSHSTVGTTQSIGKCRLKSKTLVFQAFYKGTRQITVKFYARKSEARALQEMDPLGFISVFWARALIMSNGEITLRKY